MEAAQALLAMTGQDTSPEPEWSEVKADLARDMADRHP